jgi:hypothetical protein
VVPDELADVAGAEPAVNGERLFLARQLVVAEHDVRAFDEDLTVLVELDLDVADRRADGTERVVIGAVDGDDR